jgi:hypothetical protein
MKPESVAEFSFPDGPVWRARLAGGAGRDEALQ